MSSALGRVRGRCRCQALFGAGPSRSRGGGGAKQAAPLHEARTVFRIFRMSGRSLPCARQSLGKEEGRCREEPAEDGNLPKGTLQVGNLPGKGWPPAGSESCVERQQWSLRSVDSGGGGPVIEPRKSRRRRGRRRGKKRRQHSCTVEAWCEELGRGQRAGRTPEGVPPGTWEAPTSRSQSRLGSGSSRVQSQGQECPPPLGANSGHNCVSAKRRKRSAARWASGSQSALIVPRKPGNRPVGAGGGKRGTRRQN